MSTIPIFGDEQPIPRCPGGCGGEAPLAFPCPSCERPFHPDGPAAQLAAVMARLEATRAAYVAEIEAHQGTVKTALADHAAAYVQLAGWPARCEEKTRQLHAVREALRIRPCEKLWTALECAQQRMREHQDMTSRLSQLETPVADMTPGQLEQELATSRAAHEATALERDKAVTELAMMRVWIEQARPVVEAVREFQKCPFNQDDLNERTAALRALRL